MKITHFTVKEPRFCGSFSFFTWEQRKVKDVANRYDNLRIPVAANLRVSGRTPYYGANGIQDYVDGFTHEGEFVLVAEDGANDLKNYPVNLVKGRIWVNNHAHVLQTIAKIANNAFLAYSINQADIESLLVGGGRAKLNAETLMNIEIPFPALSEQEIIGEFLASIDNLITLHQRKEIRDFLTKIDIIIAQNMAVAWEQREVGELLVERNQKAPMSVDYPLMAFIANEGVAPKGERYDRSALVTDTENKLYKKTEFGDFIYSSNNLETGSIGLNKYGKASISPVYSIFEPTGIADSDFLGRRLVRKDFINAMVKWRQGVIYGQWRIHESDFIKIEISVPRVEEQRKIGLLLDQLDNLITLHQCKENVSCFALSNLSSFQMGSFFNNDWEQRELDELLIRISTGLNPRDNFVLNSGGKNYYVTIKNFEHGHLYLDDSCDKVDDEALWLIQQRSDLRKDDILFTSIGRVGDCYLIENTPENWNINESVFTLRPNKTYILPLYLFHTIHSDKVLAQILSNITGSTFKSIKISDLKKAIIPTTSFDEQDKISRFISIIDNLITLHQRQLERLKNIKSALLEKMFV